MLNFRNTNIVLAVLLAALVVFHINHSVSFWWYIILIIAYSLILFYGSYCVESQFYMKTICSAATDEKKIAISFDDGPQENYTKEILKILNAANAKASFFCIGKNAAANINLLKEIHQQGHIIGSHSYSHGFWFDLLSAKKMQDDLEKMHQLVQKEIGVELRFFRPPYGVTTPNLKKAVHAMRYTTIGWNVRSMDTVAKDEAALLGKLKNGLKPGAIFLFHDTIAITKNILPQFLATVQQSGYEIVALDKLLNLTPYAD